MTVLLNVAAVLGIHHLSSPYPEYKDNLADRSKAELCGLRRYVQVVVQKWA